MICTNFEVYQFYAQRKAQPKWAAPHIEPKQNRIVSIDRVVNLNGGLTYSREHYSFASQNLCSLLKSVRKRQSLVAYLYEVSNKPGTIIDAAKRSAFAAKWYSKLTGMPKQSCYHGVPISLRYRLELLDNLIAKSGVL